MTEAYSDDPSVEGAWVFVSHSHHDLRDVRRVRDVLEAKGHQPLLFFLKCLGDDSEVDDLIRREIEARQIFLLCDSPNARASRYVQEEIKLITNLPDKVRVDLALDEDWRLQLDAIDELSRRATIFVSYSRRSEESARLADRLAVSLHERDYRVFLDLKALRPEAPFADEIRGAIDRAVDNGLVVVLLSPEAIRSEWVTRELLYAYERLSLQERLSGIVPVIAGQRSETVALLQSSPLRPIIATAPLDFTAGVFEDNFDRLISRLARG